MRVPPLAPSSALGKRLSFFLLPSLCLLFFLFSSSSRTCVITLSAPGGKSYELPLVPAAAPEEAASEDAERIVSKKDRLSSFSFSRPFSFPQFLLSVALDCASSMVSAGKEASEPSESWRKKGKSAPLLEEQRARESNWKRRKERE